MKNTIAFLSSAVIAAICAFIYTANIIPAGEESFGIAKMAPFLLARSVFEFFSLIWFPANLFSVFAFRKKGSQYPAGEVIVTVASAILFAYAAGSFGRNLYHMRFSKVHFQADSVTATNLPAIPIILWRTRERAPHTVRAAVPTGAPVSKPA